MNFKHFAPLAAVVLCACTVASCSSEDSPNGGGNGGDYKASRMDISGSSALAILSPQTGSRADMTFDQPGLYKIDEQGNITAVSVFLTEDDEGNTSSQEIRTHVVPGSILNLTDNYFALADCYYTDDNGKQLTVPPLYSSLIVRRKDGRIFAAGENEMLKKLIFNSGLGAVFQSIMPVNADEFIIYGWNPDFGALMARIKFDGSDLTMQEMGTNGVVDTPTYINGNIYSVLGPTAGVQFGKGGYDMFDATTFDTPAITSYVVLANGLGAVTRKDEFSTESNSYIFYTLDTPSSGNATVTKLAELNNIPNETVKYNFGLVKFCYDNGTKIILQSDSEEGTYYYDMGSSYTIIDKASGTWEVFEPAFGHAAGFELAKYNMCDGRIWGLLTENGHIQPTALWLDPVKLTSGTVSLDMDLKGIDLTRTDTDFSHAKVIFYGTRRTDEANVVIEANLATGQCDTVFTNPTYDVVTFMPLN